MPSVSIISVGKIKEKSIRDAVMEYERRLSRFCTFKSIELPDRPIPENPHPAEEAAVLQKEARDILSKINKSDYVITLCIEGKKLSSVDFAHKMSSAFMQSSSIVFVIGSSLGLDESVKAASHLRLSMSDMTFPHNLARLMLTEQVYRAFKINANETYHK